MIRRLLAIVLVASLAAACGIVQMPRMGEGPPHISPRGSFQMGAAPVKGADARFAVASVTGAPPNLIRAVSNALTAEAEVRKLILVEAGDPSATYRIKGYLSAIGDGSGTTLVFVWDVLDQNGRRLHRVSGQEPGKPASGDPWTGIESRTAAAAGRRTIDALADWSRAG